MTKPELNKVGFVGICTEIHNLDFVLPTLIKADLQYHVSMYALEEQVAEGKEVARDQEEQVSSKIFFSP